MLMILALDSGRGRVRPTGSVTPEHPPRGRALPAATRSARSRQAGDRSATTAALPAGDGGIQRFSVWRRIPAERHRPVGWRIRCGGVVFAKEP